MSFGYEKFIKKSFRGGGNRSLGRDIVRKIELAAKQLGSEAASFLDAKMRRGEVCIGIAAISRHSERQRKNPAYYCNTSKLKGIHMKNFSETDQASMPLGIFASKSVTCRHSNADLHKKSAFTLAEVLITLGIIGVVAALTLPTLIANYQKKVLVTQFKRSIVFVQNSYRKILADEEVDSLFDTPFAFKTCKRNSHMPSRDDCSWGTYQDKFASKFGYELLSIDSLKSSPLRSLKDDGINSYISSNGFCLAFISDRDEYMSGESVHLGSFVDVNCDKAPNKVGRDFFFFLFNSDAKFDFYGYGGWEDVEGMKDLCNEDIFKAIDFEDHFWYRVVGVNCAARIMSEGWVMNY